MKKLTLKILGLSLMLFLISNVGFAHQDFTVCLRYGKLTVKYKTGFDEFELNNQMKIFGFLANRYIKDNFDTTKITDILFHFDHNYTKSDTNFCGIGYGKYKIWEFSQSLEEYETDRIKGVMIFVNAYKLNMHNALKMIDYSLKNEEIIQQNQKQLDFKTLTNPYYSLKTIPQSNIDKIIDINIPEIDTVLNIKLYRKLERNKQSRDIDYYIQNEKFHFYNTNKDAGKEFPNGEMKGTYNEDILVLDYVKEIVGDYNIGHFIFNTDSTFYFIPQYKDTILGSFEIKNIRDGRQPILKFYNEWNPNRFILFMNDYDSYNKVAFFPDYGILIQDYKAKEDSLINEILKIEQGQEKILNKDSRDWIKFLSIMLNGLLLISIIFVIKKRLK